MCLDHFWVRPVCVCVCVSVSVLEGDFCLTPYISRGECPTRSSLGGTGFSSLQAAGTASGALLPKTPQSVLLLSSAVLLKCQLLTQPLSGSLQRHSLSCFPGRFLLQVASGHLRYLPGSPDFYLRKNTTRFYYVQILSSKLRNPGFL